MIAVACLTACKSDEAKSEAAPTFTLNGESFEPRHHIARRLTYEDPIVEELDELIVVSSTCKIDCGYFDGNRHATPKPTTCPKGDVVVVRFRAAKVTGGGEVETGSYTTTSGPGTATVSAKAARAGKQFETTGEAGSIELLSIGADQVSYKADLKVAGEAKKEWLAEPISSLSTSEAVVAKVCPGLHRVD